MDSGLELASRVGHFRLFAMDPSEQQLNAAFEALSDPLKNGVLDNGGLEYLKTSMADGGFPIEMLHLEEIPIEDITACIKDHPKQAFLQCALKLVLKVRTCCHVPGIFEIDRNSRVSGK